MCGKHCFRLQLHVMKTLTMTIIFIVLQGTQSSSAAKMPQIVKNDTFKTDMVKTDGVKMDIVKAKEAKTDRVKAEVAKNDVVKAEVAKIDGVEAEVAKIDVVKAEVAKTNGVKAEVAKTDGVKAEVAKTDDMLENTEMNATKQVDMQPTDSLEGNKEDSLKIIPRIEHGKKEKKIPTWKRILNKKHTHRNKDFEMSIWDKFFLISLGWNSL